jgi:hypothetical protein
VRRTTTTLAIAGALSFLAACGATEAGVGTAVEDVAADPGPPDDASDPSEVRYDCFGVDATAAEIADADEVAELADHPGAAAFAAATDTLDGWLALEVENDRLGAIRPLEPPDVLDGEVRDHERLVVERVGEAGGEEADADGWMASSAGPCTLRADLDGLGAATILLDPDAPRSNDDTSLSLWVVEPACASGRPATGRVVTSVDETDDEIRLVVGVEPAGGDQECPSNPPTPITVELDEPLGDRPLVDAARLPPIELEEAPAGLSPDG